MNFTTLTLVALASSSLVCLAQANTEPTVIVNSATMRDGTTLMDVSYRVNDPDDATVKVRALAFVDGVRSFANVIRPETFVEGTASNLGDAIAANTDHTLTWDVGADWDVDLAQVKFEVLAQDSRGLLEFDWITIPATATNDELIVSENSPTDSDVLEALFWQYAIDDVDLNLENGVLKGSSTSGVFSDIELVNGSILGNYAPPFTFMKMNLNPNEDLILPKVARADLLQPTHWHATNTPYVNVPICISWGTNDDGLNSIPTNLTGVIAISAGYQFNLALKGDGTVIAWGNNDLGQTNIPASLKGVIAIDTGGYHSIALKDDGTVVAWGVAGSYGQTNVPAGLSGVIAIAAGGSHCLALKDDGTVVGWGGSSTYDPGDIPEGLTGVIAIAGGSSHSLALKDDGTVVTWGYSRDGVGSIPVNLTGVVAIAAGASHSLALKDNGTVVTWGSFSSAINFPVSLTGVTAIAAGSRHSLALKSDGTATAWGSNEDGQADVPTSTGITHISAGGNHSLAIIQEAP